MSMSGRSHDSAGNGLMSERQKNVMKVLVDRSPRIAGMYRTALAIISDEAVPGCESARISTICHCMRELMSGLPAIMSDISIPRPTPSSDSLMKDLPGLVALHPDVDLALDQDLVPVPRTFARVLATLVRTVSQEQGRNRANAAALVTGDSEANHPAMTQWLSAYRYFLNWTHLDRNHDQERLLPSDIDLLTNIRVVEDVIEVRGALFFENLHAVEDLLAEINELEEQAPDADA